MMPFVKAGWVPLCGVFALWAAAFVISCSTSAPSLAIAETPGVHSAGYQLLGVSRKALAWSFYRTADVYFHRGIEDLEPPRLPGIVGALDRQLKVVGHVHLEPGRIGEIFPWLRLALLLDPTDPRFYATASFWLQNDAHRVDLAIALLHEARRHVPDDYRVHLELASVLMRNKDHEKAVGPLNAAATLWPSALSANDEQAHLDRRAIYLYRGHIHELAGRVDEAVADFRRLIALSDENPSIELRIQELLSDQDASVNAADVLQSLHSRDEHLCGEWDRQYRGDDG